VPAPPGSLHLGVPPPPAPGIRVLALCVFRAGDRILVSHVVDARAGAVYHRPLGGGVEFGETAAAAVRREMREELGAEIADVALLGVLENVFVYEGEARHEVVFVFDARLVDAALYARDALPVTEEGDGWADARWVALADFAAGRERLVPAGLLELLEGG
jgi:ADP-ribose pyrophosphatase YjhB (NUDIX family)